MRRSKGIVSKFETLQTSHNASNLSGDITTESHCNS